MKWIDATREVPEDHTEVLVMVTVLKERGGYEVAKYWNDEWHNTNGWPVAYWSYIDRAPNLKPHHKN